MTIPIKNIFIHFLDKEVLNLLGIKPDVCSENNKKIYQQLRLATRLAFLLCSQKVLIPASNYFESVWAKKILDELKDFGNFGYLGLISSSMNIQDFIDRKREQYLTDKSRYPIYFENLNYFPKIATWIPRISSATEDITRSWFASINSSKIWQRIYPKTAYNTVGKFELALSRVPENLEGSAFISDFVYPLIFWKDNDNKAFFREKNYINLLITKAYINSFLEEFDAICLKDIPLVNSDILLYENRYHISIFTIKQKLLIGGIIEEIEIMESKCLFDFKHSQQWSLLQKELITSLMFNKRKTDNLIVAPEQTEKSKVDMADNLNTQNVIFNVEKGIFHVNSELKGGNKPVNINQEGNFGIGVNQGEIKADKIAGSIDEAQPKSMTETVSEIQQLLKQLSQTHPTSTTTEQMVVATKAIEQIESNPDLKQKVINAAREGGLAAFEKVLDNPIGALITGAIKGWLEAKAE